MVTPSDLEKRNNFLAQLRQNITQQETDFSEILHRCGWKTKVCDKCRGNEFVLDCECVTPRPIKPPAQERKEDQPINSDFFYEGTCVATMRPNSYRQRRNDTPEERLLEYEGVLQGTRGKRPVAPPSVEYLLTIDFSRPTKKEKTQEELLMEENMRKRRRPTYTGKTHTKSKDYKQVLRGMIENISEFVKAANEDTENHVTEDRGVRVGGSK